MRFCERFRASGRPTLSMEVFPARTSQAAEKLETTLDRLAGLKPDFMSVTFGAGGSTRQGSRELAAKLQSKGVEVLAYVAGYGLGPEQLAEVFDAYDRMHIDNVLLVRGDPPREDSSFQPHPDSFAHASGLIEFVRSHWGFCLGAAAHPEGHPEATSKEADLGFLRQKVEAGAEFLIANYFYDNAFFLDFRSRCRSAGIQVPIVPGVMPIYSIKMTESLAAMCGASIPAPLREALSRLPDGDKEAVSQFGIAYATEQCRGLLRAGVPGLHLYTMDRAASVQAIVGTLRAEGLLD